MFRLMHKPTYSQAEIHQQIADISELQRQRKIAQGYQNKDQIDNADNLIECAQLYLERMMEKQ